MLTPYWSGHTVQCKLYAFKQLMKKIQILNPDVYLILEFCKNGLTSELFSFGKLGLYLIRQ